MGLNNLEIRIEKGIKRIAEAKAEGSNVSDWEKHLKKLKRDYKEKLLKQAFNEIKEFYLPGMYQWIEDNEKELLKELQKIENELSISMVKENEDEKFKQSLESFKNWHYKAIAAFKAKSIEQGGDIEMGITIEAEELVEPGVYDAAIVEIDSIEGKYGDRLQVTFDVGEGRHTNGFFALKATPNNKTGVLFEKALGELRTADSDELIGKRVKVLVEHKQVDGRTYSNVSKIL